MHYYVQTIGVNRLLKNSTIDEKVHFDFKRGINMKIKPIGKRVLIKTVKEEERTKGGIYIPESAKEKKKQGIVIEVGTIDEKEFPIKKGDIILYAGYSSEELELEGEKYLIIESKDVIAKIEG
jgi:chaperonin GroES